MLRVYPSESSIAVSEGEREVEICANMVGLSERPIDIVLTTSDFSAMGESGLSFMHVIKSASTTSTCWQAKRAHPPI